MSLLPQQVREDTAPYELASLGRDAQLAVVAARRSSARAKAPMRCGDSRVAEAFEAGQTFLDTAARLSRERRLRRLVYLAHKPS